LLRIAVVVFAFALFIGVTQRSQVAGAALPIAVALSCGLTLFGPYSFRNDLRQDMLQLSLLKTWPVSGERLLWGEMVSPWLVTTALVYVCIAATGALALGVRTTTLTWTARLALGCSALVLFPALIFAQIVVQNAAVVLFPGWVPTGPSRPRGVEAMGQGMLLLAGSALLLVLGVLPGALVGGIIGFVGFRLIGWFALVPASVMVAGLLAVEAVAAVHLLGGVLDRTDPTAVAPAG